MITIRDIMSMVKKDRRSYIVGQLGEDIARLSLKGAYSPKTSHRGDLRYKGLGIEVKLSNKGKYGYNFQLRKHDKYGSTSHLFSKYVILYCVDGMQNLFCFVIPTYIIKSISKIRIATHPTKYTGKYRKYLTDYKHIKDAIL